MGFSSKRSYNDYEPISEGKHIAQMTKCVLGQSRKGKDMLTMRWTIVDVRDGQEGRTWRDYIVLEEKPWGYGKLAELCRAADVLGCDDDPDGLDPHNQVSVHKHLVGVIASIETKNEESQGSDGRSFTNTRSEQYSEAVWAAEAPDLPFDAYLDFNDEPIGAALEDDWSDGGSFNDGFAENDVPF